jgi:REP element-mobilizing transposase RayT
MILASHVIFGVYGFWLPNDPRGSWSDFVGAWELFRFGPATKVETRASLAHQPHDRAARRAAKEALKYPPVHLTGVQARAVGRGFAESARKGRVTVLACAILPEHVHLVIARHRCKVEWIVNQMKGAATRRLLEEQLHPFAAWQPPDGRVPMCWAAKLWKVYLDSEDAIARAVAYVEANHLKEGKPRQRWQFVGHWQATGVD